MVFGDLCLDKYLRADVGTVPAYPTSPVYTISAHLEVGPRLVYHPVPVIVLETAFGHSW